MNIERIVADFETCKKAAEMGLKINTIFHWFKRDDDGEISFTIETKMRADKFPSTAPAPTAEEVPLPFRIEFKYEKGYYAVRISHWKVTFDTQGGYGKSRHEIKIAPNEATARLKMAIWLIENVPEARQWYVENGYLDEAMFKAWQEANHARD
jgi:hypothetical protein